jgi:hypothetical protein
MSERDPSSSLPPPRDRNPRKRRVSLRDSPRQPVKEFLRRSPFRFPEGGGGDPIAQGRQMSGCSAAVRASGRAQAAPGRSSRASEKFPRRSAIRLPGEGRGPWFRRTNGSLVGKALQSLDAQAPVDGWIPAGVYHRAGQRSDPGAAMAIIDLRPRGASSRSLHKPERKGGELFGANVCSGSNLPVPERQREGLEAALSCRCKAAAIQQVLPPFATFAAAPGSTIGRQGPDQ